MKRYESEKAVFPIGQLGWIVRQYSPEGCDWGPLCFCRTDEQSKMIALAMNVRESIDWFMSTCKEIPK